MTVDDLSVLGVPARLLCTLAGAGDPSALSPFESLPAISQRSWFFVGQELLERGTLAADGAFTAAGLRRLQRQQEINRASLPRRSSSTR